MNGTPTNLLRPVECGAHRRRESDRGLISEIGGVQFATGTANINASAREGLAKFSGIVASYPGLRFNVEGHTDSTGSDATNNELSMRRAITVRDYLIAQGVPASSIDVAGLGSSTPLGDNTTADGRSRNRRVDIVLTRRTARLEIDERSIVKRTARCERSRRFLCTGGYAPQRTDPRRHDMADCDASGGNDRCSNTVLRR